MEQNSNDNITEHLTDFADDEKPHEKSDETKEDTVFQSVLTNTENTECEYEKKLKCNHMVLLVDDHSESKYLNKLNSLSSGDFIEEDFIPNQLNISNSDDEYSNLRESNFDNFQSLKNNLNQFDQNFKIIEQKDKILLPKAADVKNTSNIRSNSLNDIAYSNDNCCSIIKTELTGNHIFGEATVLNRNNLSHSSSLSSSYSNINSNPNKSSSNSLTNHLEIKFDSESSIEDNSKFNLNTSALTESTILVSDNKAKLSKHEATIWTETEAIINQFDQIGPSACGSTAILNILKALNFNFDLQNISSKVKVNFRVPEEMASLSSLAEYLFSRSIAGMSEKELIENIECVTDNKISGRFFHFYPLRDVNLSEWLAYWIRKGAVPVALLNLQKSPVWGFVPDAWHHQMIYACDSNFIYLTNPLESKSIESVMDELTSESVLLVRSTDVVKRFVANKSNLIDLLILKGFSNEEKKRWYDLNVLGQVIKVLRENTFCENVENNLIKGNDYQDSLNQASFIEIHPTDLSDTSSGHLKNQVQANSAESASKNWSHIKIPASYKAGISLFAYKDSELFKEIQLEKELPFKK